jgi:hypothetical protein
MGSKEDAPAFAGCLTEYDDEMLSDFPDSSVVYLFAGDSPFSLGQ